MEPETIDGYQIDLSDGRHVFVARHDDHFFVKFRNSEGAETRLKLSRDAADALRHLLADHIPADEMVMEFIAHMSSAARAAETKMGWQAVRPDAVAPGTPT